MRRERYGEGNRSPRHHHHHHHHHASEAHVLVPTMDISDVQFITEEPSLAELELPTEEDNLMIEIDEGGRHRFHKRGRLRQNNNPYRSSTNHFLRDIVNSHRCLRKCGFSRIKRFFCCLAFISVVTTMVVSFFLLSLSLSVQMNYRVSDCRQLALRAQLELDGNELNNSRSSSGNNNNNNNNNRNNVQLTHAPTPRKKRLLTQGKERFLLEDNNNNEGEGYIEEENPDNEEDEELDERFLNFSGWETFRLNQFRWMGTHNSYHLSSPLPIAPHHYSHAPLVNQLGWYDHGVRQVELDVHLIDDIFVVYHLHFVDDATTCYCLTQCLRQLKEWSDRHVLHFPLFVMIEIKSKVWEDVNTALFGFSNKLLINLENEIVSVFPRDRLLIPDHVRGKYKDLRTAFLSSDAGWPLLRDCLGKFVFVWLDDIHDLAATVPEIKDDPALKGRLFFIAQLDPARAYASIIVINDPRENNYEVNVKTAVRAGLLVRTMADSPNNLHKDPDRFSYALNSGAQIITTDFECVNRTTLGWIWRHPGETYVDDGGTTTDTDPSNVNEYCESLPSGRPFECNPFNAPENCEHVTSNFFGLSVPSRQRPLWSSREGWLGYFAGLAGF